MSIFGTRSFNADAVVKPLADMGDQLSLYGQAIAGIPRVLRRYRKEVMRLIATTTFGSGGLAVIAGTAGVMFALSLFVGSLVGLQGFRGLDTLGAAALTGFITAFFNTRDIAPLIAGVALTATVGAGFTAEIGAQRIAEEIDALEVMAVPSVPYLITTRVHALSAATAPRGVHPRDIPMLHYAVVFFVIAVIAALLGFSGIAGAATNIAWILFVVFLILGAVSLLRGRKV